MIRFIPLVFTLAVWAAMALIAIRSEDWKAYASPVLALIGAFMFTALYLSLIIAFS